METISNKLETITQSFTCVVTSGPLNLTVILADGNVKVIGTVQYGKIERDEVLLSYEVGEKTAMLRIRENLDTTSVATLHAAVITAATVFVNGEPVVSAAGEPALRGITTAQLNEFNKKVGKLSGLRV